MKFDARADDPEWMKGLSTHLRNVLIGSMCSEGLDPKSLEGYDALKSEIEENGHQNIPNLGKTGLKQLESILGWWHRPTKAYPTCPTCNRRLPRK